jgi:hypothetical protein
MLINIHERGRSGKSQKIINEMSFDKKEFLKFETVEF